MVVSGAAPPRVDRVLTAACERLVSGLSAGMVPAFDHAMAEFKTVKRQIGQLPLFDEPKD